MNGYLRNLIRQAEAALRADRERLAKAHMEQALKELRR